MKPIGVVLHHSAGNEKTAAQLRATFKQRFNVSYIGYHAAISKTGEVWSDLRWDQIGIHNNVGRLNNTNSVGICLIGNFESEQPTIAQLENLERYLRELVAFYKIPLANIIGHRDMKSTACPGKNFYSLIDSIKSKLNTSPMADERLVMNDVISADSINHKVAGTDLITMTFTYHDLHQFRDIMKQTNKPLLEVKHSTNIRWLNARVTELETEIASLKAATPTTPTAPNADLIQLKTILKKILED